MSHAQRWAPARLWATLLALLLAVFGVTMLVQPAHADPVTGELVVSDGGPVLAPGTAATVRLAGEQHRIGTGLFQLKVGDAVLLTYCIDFETAARGNVDYVESDWKARGEGWEEKGAKITWILNHAVPKLSTERFVSDLTAGGVEVNGLSPAEAVAATQAAIWHLSDGKELAEAGNDQDVAEVYRYLVKNAETTTAEPKPTLDLAPDRLSGRAGDKIGPFKITTNADEIKVRLHASADGVKLVGKGGDEVKKVKDGDELYVDVPAGSGEGHATIRAEGEAEVGVGRVFKGRHKTQTLILAGTGKVAVCADATAVWSKAEIPAAPGAKVTSECAEGGVRVTLTNSAKEGGAKAGFTVESKDFREEFEVEAGGSTNVVVPVAEDSDYAIKVSGKQFSEELTGHRDCAKPSASPTPTPTATPTTAVPQQGRPAPAPGGLATTGANNLGLQLGIGAVLLALGGLVLFYLRRRTAGQQGRADR